jgi:glycosyl transferase family 25
MQVFVINLPEDSERRCAIEAQLQGLGLSFELLPAVRGTSPTTDERRAHYDEVRFIRNEGRAALPGELGCALSHIAAYRLIVERGLPHALILEDDAWLNPNLPLLLEAIEERFRPDQRNVFLLTWVAATSSRKRGFLWSTYFLAEAKSAWCTHGYAVSNSAAVALLANLYPVRHLADCWNWLRRHRIVDVLAVSPTCITSDLSFDTRTTAGLADATGKRPAGVGLLHKMRRAYWRSIDLASAVLGRIGGNS